MQSGKTSGGAGSKKRKKMALGRGLDALIPGIEAIEESASEYFQCDVDLIRPNRYQPRLDFSGVELEALCRSIKEQGIIQPLLIRKDDPGYELVAGERRLRAAKMAGLTQVPVIIKEVADSEMLEISIVENIQRANLNPIEECEAYNCLITAFNLTQDQVAERVGKSRSAVANFLRLRQLPKEIRDDLGRGVLTVGHARALLGVETPAQQRQAWRVVVAKGLSVRQTEALVKRLKSEMNKPEASPPSSEEVYFAGLAEDLSRHFGTKVQIKRRGQKGRVEIEFYNNADLDYLLERLKQM